MNFNARIAVALALVLPFQAIAKDEHGLDAAASTVAIATALQDLADGNARFVSATQAPRALGSDRRKELAKGQDPKAVILGCSDSRVPPEHIFDQQLGDLFVVRTAGNVADTVALGSIEYAAEHLGTHLVVVLGHSSCGAVKATVEAGDHAPEGNLGAIVKAIQPAVASAKKAGGASLVDGAIHENELNGARALVQRSQVLEKLVQEGQLKIVVATYDLASGRVVFDPTH